MNTLVKGSIEIPALMRSYDAAILQQNAQHAADAGTASEASSASSITPYYVLGAVASEGLGGGAMKASVVRGGGGGKGA